MKFAVVEYTSKTGTVWRHRDDRPNFLADPDTEMDPTSFGCYVSALGGEHVPMLGLIIGPVERVARGQVMWRKVIKRLRGRWPQTYSLKYFESFDVLLVVYQISDGHEVTALVARLKIQYPHLFIIGVPTQPYGMLKKYWNNHPAWLDDFKEFVDSCDVFISIVNGTTPIWQKLTTTPVKYLPQPYPVEFTRQFFIPRHQKKKVIYVAGVISREEIARGFAVAGRLQKRLPEYEIHYTNTPGETPDAAMLESGSFTPMPFLQWRKHLAYLGSVALVINTDYTQTRGRVQVDSAAVGTPSIGANSDGQIDLFPQLPATRHMSIESLVDQGERLLTQPAWYDEVISLAQQRLGSYDYVQSAQRLRELVTQYQ